ncbi:hypothetical protein LQF12_02110 [Ruania suaedae]|uniref:hypothetical protein n=1 Tax=Ruania suaedae TaxID=2897774 RepID=UPI001E36C226|nr:hypothetical protein [Ruania suaedae]UFU03426.1 hypothetical protein LQF12_02110 [Ruania suaedae]
MEWQALIAGGAITTAGWWLTQGAFGYYKTRQARNADLAADEREAAQQEEADERTRRIRAEARVRVLDDYAHRLRGQLAAAGIVPDPWPDPMTDEA